MVKQAPKRSHQVCDVPRNSRGNRESKSNDSGNSILLHIFRILVYLFAATKVLSTSNTAKMKPAVLSANRKMPMSIATVRMPSRAPRSVRLYCRASSPPPDAIVIGGGIAGLLTASVLSKRVDKVLLIEKDDITGTVETETFGEVR